MQIKKKLFVTAVLPFFFAVVIAVVFWSAYQHVNRMYEVQNTSSQIVQKIFELNILTHEYLLYREERPRRQWFEKRDQIVSKIAWLHERSRDAERRDTLVRMLREMRQIESVFSLISTDVTAVSERQARLVGQLVVRSHALATEAFRLEDEAGRSVLSLYVRFGFVILLVIAAGGMAMSAVAFSINRGIQAQIARLRKGTEIIGKGNWDYRIRNISDDEFSDLAVSFNRMAARVKRAIYKRRRAEGEVKAAYDKLELRVRERTRELAEAHERYDVAVNSSRIGVWEWFLESGQVYYSESYCRMIGFSASEVSGDVGFWKNSLHPEDRERVLDAVQDYLEVAQRPETEQVPFFESEFRLRHRDGKYRWVLSRGRVYHDSEGTAYRMAGTHVDISELKEAEGNLRSLSSDLKQSNLELEQFASIVSHDLQEPLRNILSFADLMQLSGSDLDQESRDYLERIQNSGSRMKGLIEDLLHFSRATARSNHFGDVDLDHLVRDVLYDLQTRVEETGAVIAVRNLPQIEGNALQLRQVIQNFLSNALKFRRSGVRPRIDISGEINSSSVTVRIRDNGIGFDAAQKEQIFEPFRRLQAENYEGSGIGLAICAKIIKNHQGEIEVHSMPGEGTEFAIHLPSRQVSLK